MCGLIVVCTLNGVQNALNLFELVALDHDYISSILDPNLIILQTKKFLQVVAQSTCVASDFAHLGPHASSVVIVSIYGKVSGP